MNKYLVIRNSQYYPSPGTEDWQSVHDTEEEAELAAEKLRACKYDWVCVVDLALEIERLQQVKS